MRFSRRALRLNPSSIVALANRARELERSGTPVLRMETGEPNFPTPPGIRKAAIDALERGLTGYSHSRGVPELRQALCGMARDRFGVDLDPERNVIVTPGAKQAILYALLATIDPGDEVIVMTPAWVSYDEMIKLADGVPVHVGLSGADGFAPAIDAVESKVTPRTKALILNSPNNPTGHAIGLAALEDLHRFCARSGILLISDEIYGRLVFRGHEHHSLHSVDPELDHGIVVDGFSKSYAMAGWRLGFVFASGDMIDAIDRLQQNSVTCPPTFLQYGALEALRDEESFVQFSLVQYQRNLDDLERECRTIPRVGMVRPQGGIYAFIDIRQVMASSARFASMFLERESVSTVPGIAFGDVGEGYLRVCLAVSNRDIAGFVRRLRRFVEIAPEEEKDVP